MAFLIRSEVRMLQDILWNVPARVSFSRDEFIFRVGDPADLMYVVGEGEVEILIDNRVVEVVYREGVFGEMALIDGQPRAASARARTPCVLVPITKKHLLLLLRSRPDFAIEVMRVMSRRIRSADLPK